MLIRQGLGAYFLYEFNNLLKDDWDVYSSTSEGEGPNIQYQSMKLQGAKVTGAYFLYSFNKGLRGGPPRGGGSLPDTAEPRE